MEEMAVIKIDDLEPKIDISRVSAPNFTTKGKDRKKKVKKNNTSSSYAVSEQ